MGRMTKAERLADEALRKQIDEQSDHIENRIKELGLKFAVQEFMAEYTRRLEAATSDDNFAVLEAFAGANELEAEIRRNNITGWMMRQDMELRHIEEGFKKLRRSIEAEADQPAKSKPPSHKITK